MDEKKEDKKRGREENQSDVVIIEAMPRKWPPDSQVEELGRQLQQDDVTVVCAAMDRLGNIILHDRTGARVNSAVSARCHVSVIAVMQKAKWTNDENIQEKGCFCISELSGKRFHPMVEALGEEGALEAIATAMKSFPQSMKLQEMCCRAAGNIVENGVVVNVVEVARFADELDGLKCVVNALRLNNSEVDVAALRLLRWMSSHDEKTREKLKAVGATAAVGSWIVRFGQQLEESGCADRKALRSLMNACAYLQCTQV